jgi:hypothetical protein
MTKQDLIKQLKELSLDDGHADVEMRHLHADALLLSFINDKEITEAFEAIRKWYA